MEMKPLGEDGRVNLVLEVQDTGIGISCEFQKSLFMPFMQEGRNDAADNRGSGLGLAIVKKLVDRMSGTINVRSTPGKGSCFTVSLTVDSILQDAVREIRNARKEEKNTGHLAGCHGPHFR